MRSILIFVDMAQVEPEQARYGAEESGAQYHRLEQKEIAFMRQWQAKHAK